MTQTTEGTHIFFRTPWDSSRTRKQNSWSIRTKGDEEFLGEIRWFAHWRQYRFLPGSRLRIQEQTCMRGSAILSRRSCVHEQPPERTTVEFPIPEWMRQPLRVRGVGRVADEPRALLVSFTDIPTDDGTEPSTTTFVIWSARVSDDKRTALTDHELCDWIVGPVFASAPAFTLPISSPVFFIKECGSVPDDTRDDLRRRSCGCLFWRSTP